MEDLQKDFKILPVGIAPAGAWKYAFIYQITARHFPDLLEQARVISESQARQKLLELYFESIGAAQVRDVNKLFGWGNELCERATTKLLENKKLKIVKHPKQNGEWLALPKLCK